MNAKSAWRRASSRRTAAVSDGVRPSRRAAFWSRRTWSSFRRRLTTLLIGPPSEPDKGAITLAALYTTATPFAEWVGDGPGSVVAGMSANVQPAGPRSRYDTLRG